MRKSKLRKKIIHISNKRFGKQKEHWKCSYPGCDEFAIDSHTISESQLRKIADDLNKVFGPQQNFWRAINFESLQEQFDVFDYLGVNQASTHRAFCNNHDQEVFGPIENGNEIQVVDKKQLYTMYFRAFCSQYFQTKEAVFFRTIIRKVNAENNCQSFNETYEVKRMKYLQDFLEPLFLNLVKDDPLNLYSRTFILKKELHFLTCSLIQFPQTTNWDDFFSINTFIQDGTTLVVFSSVEDKSEQVDSMLSPYDNDSIEKFLFQCSFELSSNAYVSPVWWNNLSQNERLEIENLNIDLAKEQFYD